MLNHIKQQSEPLQKHSIISEIINLKKLERENRKYLITGYIIGILLLIVLDPYVSFRRKSINTIKNQTMRRITVKLITLPLPKPGSDTAQKSELVYENPASPIQKKKSDIPPVITEAPVSAITEDSLETTAIDEKRLKTVLKDTPLSEEFPSLVKNEELPFYAKRDSTKINYLSIPFRAQGSDEEPFDITKLHADIPLSENTVAILGPGYGVVYYDPFPDEEEEEDERRQFKYDILGIPIGGKGVAFGVGPGAVFVEVGGLINSGRHLLKSIKWKIEDAVTAKHIESVRNGTFTMVTEKDMRFFVLLWKYDRLDPRLITYQERRYIAEAETEQIMPHFKYLESMEKRGLASSLKKNGRLVYKANFSREELFHTFLNAYGAIEETGTKKMVLNYLNLIADSYQSFKKG